MKKILLNATMLMFAASLTIFTSCKKASTTTTPTPSGVAAQSQDASDDARVNSELDNATNDANASMSSSSTTAGRYSYTSSTLGTGLVCGATLDTSKISMDIITINYNGPNCSGLETRSGSITLQLTGGKWKTKGAAIYCTFNNYKITRISDGNSITFNGTHTLINYSGGLVASVLGTTTTVVHKARANNMTITFTDGTVRTWSVARQLTWSAFNTSNLQISVSGDTILAGVANTVMWGTTRSGQSFTAVLKSPIVSNTICGWFAPVSGERMINGITYPLDILFGLNTSGVAVTSGCATDYKITWTVAGTPYSALLLY
jgi:hypothetical protein